MNLASVPKNNVSCPICLSTSIRGLINLPQVPAACHILRPTRQEALAVTKGNIELGVCQECGHIFNLAFDDSLIEYQVGYENSLHFSPHFKQYAEQLADRLIEDYALHQKNIIDVGSGDGYFLRLLCERSNGQGTGFDPSYQPEAVERADSKVRFIADLYSDKYQHFPADFIMSRHVLEHVEAPREFLENLKKAIGERSDVVVHLEVPNVMHGLEHLAIWDFIYEHVSYYSQASLSYLFASAGFEILRSGSTYGNQFLQIEGRLAGEQVEAKQDPQTVLSATAPFVEQFETKLRDWRERLTGLRSADKRVVLWGTGSKAITFLNLLASQSSIEYAVDLNPRKHGMFVPGTGQEIVAPGFLQAYKPDVVIVMNPLYAEEIRADFESMELYPDLILA